MKKTLLLFSLIAAVALSAMAQSADTTKLWTIKFKSALTFNQVSLTNWAAGGENSLGGNGLFNYSAGLIQGSSTWDNTIDLGYGLIKLGDAPIRKSDDKIELMSKYGYSINHKNLYLSANLNFRTQFTEGYNYPNDSVIISKFLSPGYLMLGFGIDYKPAPYFSLSILPLTGRLTFVLDDTLSAHGAYGVDPGDKVRAEFGAAIIALFEKDILPNVNLKSKLELFTNYLDRPQNIDVNWEALLSLKVNQYLSSYIGLQTIYDHDIMITDNDNKTGPRTQFKQTFGVGLTYSFQRVKATIN